jgi:hypothetical protein
VNGFARPTWAQWSALVWFPPIPTGLLYLGYWSQGVGISVWQVWVLFVAAVAAFILVRGLRSEPARLPEVNSALSMIVDRPFAEVNRWEDRLSWSEDDAERYRLTVQRRLVDLIAERVRLRHGVDLRADPERARPVLPAVLFQIATAPLSRPLNMSEMDYVVRCMEEI